jgi:hypothetical protein
MMGSDPNLNKFLRAGTRKKFWTRIRSDGDHIQVICADSADQINQEFPQLEVFDPSEKWQSEHEGRLFREYDIEKNHNELVQNLQQAT